MTNRLAGAAIITYQILLAAIILIRPEIDPTHQPISEYAIGRLGWIAVLAFLVAASAYALLFAALRPLVRGRLGLGLLAICALGTFGVGILVADPVVTPWSAMTTAGRLHVICGLSAMVLLPFAALLINRELARRLPAAARVRHRRGARHPRGQPGAMPRQVGGHPPALMVCMNGPWPGEIRDPEIETR